MQPPRIPSANFFLRFVRTARGWRLEELAGLVGVSLTALREIETGRAFLTQERLTKYVMAMGVPTEALAKAQELLAKLHRILRP